MVGFLIFIFLAVAFGNPASRLRPVGIIGGQDADITDYPYQVSVAYDGSHGCGGSIISATKILTAAHCFDPEYTSNITVRVASAKKNDGQTVLVKKINSHPKWDETGNLENDIAVLELENPLIYGVGVQPIQLPDNSTVLVDGQNATITGWGATSGNGDQLDTLQVITEALITTSTCQEKYFGDAVYSTMICAGENGKYACNGDSGGPLVVNGVQQGIVSWGNCGRDEKPDVFTKVLDYVDFINSF